MTVITDENLYQGHSGLDIVLDDLIQRVFMSTRPTFRSITNASSPFTEKSWSHLALGVWDLHKNNYFLRKYENFKEKEWPVRV